MTTGVRHFYAQAATRRHQIRELSAGLLAPVELRGRRLIAIASSSRGCSSLLFSLLKVTGRFLTLPGEHTHLYKMAGVSRDLSEGGDDADCCLDMTTVEAFREELGWCLAWERLSRDDVRSTALRIAYTLYGQWENLPEPEQLLPLVERGLRSVDDAEASDCRRFLRLISSLRADQVEINPWYYDVPAAELRTVFPELAPPSGPPRMSTTVEEPPFLVPTMRTSDRVGMLDDGRPLLIKASVDAYRLEYLESLFGCAPEILHVTRNPAASICGLMDGWLSHKFYSHRLTTAELRITGYSDCPAGQGNWWNFDAPSGWLDYCESRLEEVCAFQWASAHLAILGSAAYRDCPVTLIRAERLQDATDRAWLCDLLSALDVPPGSFDPRLNPIVVATKPPRPGRWRDRRTTILPALQDDRIMDVSAALGYGREEDSTWL